MDPADAKAVLKFAQSKGLRLTHVLVHGPPYLSIHTILFSWLNLAYPVRADHTLALGSCGRKQRAEKVRHAPFPPPPSSRSLYSFIRCSQNYSDCAQFLVSRLLGERATAWMR